MKDFYDNPENFELTVMLHGLVALDEDNEPAAITGKPAVSFEHSNDDENITMWNVWVRADRLNYDPNVHSEPFLNLDDWEADFANHIAAQLYAKVAAKYFKTEVEEY